MTPASVSILSTLSMTLLSYAENLLKSIFFSLSAKVAGSGKSAAGILNSEEMSLNTRSICLIISFFLESFPIIGIWAFR